MKDVLKGFAPKSDWQKEMEKASPLERAEMQYSDLEEKLRQREAELVRLIKEADRIIRAANRSIDHFTEEFNQNTLREWREACRKAGVEL